MKLLYPLLLSFIFVTSCSGQNKTQPWYVVSKPAGHPKLIKTQGSNKYQNIFCGIQDKHGNLWFGITGEGVYCYDGKLFTQFTTNDGLSSNTVWSVLEDKTGNIWFGTNDGICRYEEKKRLRLMLIVMIAATLRHAMHLLGIVLPEKMLGGI
jgi:hypothetical protein